MSEKTLNSEGNRGRAELASFKRPDGLTLLPELPLTPMFKVAKQALRARSRG